jgi:flagellar basal-body rod modification protein FlgD
MQIQALQAVAQKAHGLLQVTNAATAANTGSNSTNGTNGTTSSGTSSANSVSSLTSEQTFLQLLIAQIQNQDPLNPTDSIQFIGQLVQYSELGELTSINQGVQNLAGSNSSGNGSSNNGSNSTTPSSNSTKATSLL